MTVWTINESAAVPPFEQLRGQIIAAIGDGSLAPGHKLPAVRRMAADLGIAPNTVARTYRELEQLGFVETRGRNGTVVATLGDNAHRKAQQAATDYVAATSTLGLSAAESLAVVATALGLPTESN